MVSMGLFCGSYLIGGVNLYKLYNKLWSRNFSDETKEVVASELVYSCPVKFELLSHLHALHLFIFIHKSECLSCVSE